MLDFAGGNPLVLSLAAETAVRRAASPASDAVATGSADTATA